MLTLSPKKPRPDFYTCALPLFFFRYSETQTAPNGLRYREWLTVFANESHIEKVKLDAHILDITEYHQACIPWKRDATGAVENVLARSSLPLEQRVMHDRAQNPAGTSRFTAFVRSCKARLLQDIKTLPTRGDQPSPINRVNASFYLNEAANQILLVYAPDNSQQLEFVSMSLMD
jgi:hypothetical protein